MRKSARLALSFLFAGCELISPKPKVSFPVRADTESLSFVDYPSPFSTMNGCDTSQFSNIACPFIRRRTISFKESYIEEERCSCFPEISRQRVPLSAGEKESYLKMAQGIHTLHDDGTSCVSDFSHTALKIKGPTGEQTFFVTESGWKGCGSTAAYVDEAVAHDLDQDLGYKVAPAPSVTERALRTIYNEHHGFSIVFPNQPYGDRVCLWQRTYAYKADARSIEVFRCDEDQGIRSRTIPFDEAENERLLSALKALEAPTVETSVWSCKQSAAIAFELHKKDGTPDPYEFDGPVCNPRRTPQPVDFRRRVFSPSAAGFIDLLEAYDNF